MLISNIEFIRAVFGNAPQNAVPWVTGFEEDPLTVNGERWGGAPVTNGTLPWMIDDHHNNFMAISTFRKGHDGRYHRRKECFASCHLIMVDDVGSKVQPHQIALEPSYKLETSPGNYQYAYIVDPPELDGELVARVQDAMVAQGLAVDGKDPGMKGVTHYGRLPVGRNTKAKYAEQLGGLPFVHQLEEWYPERRFTLQEIIEAFELDLDKTKTAYSSEADDPILKTLEAQGMVKGPISGKEGVYDITCPWAHEHTDRADGGTAYFQPGYGGRLKPGFKCHHGHCESRTIKDLLRVLKPGGESAGEDVRIRLTDTGNAERLKALFRGEFLHCGEWDKWLQWDGSCWRLDVTGRALEATKCLYRILDNECSRENDDDRRKAIRTWANKSESRDRRKAALELAAVESDLAISYRTLDKDHWLLTCLNGTIDLRTGELQPHNRADLLSFA